jgi:triphosphoribosyl-dephospho-CoA synthase
MLSNDVIRDSVIWACEHEVKSPKPGNVNCFSNAHDMEVQDFIDSAHAIAPVLAQSDQSVGTLILESIKATRMVVDCNTNLGIVLLFAPLCKAIQQCETFSEFRGELANVLSSLTLDDAIKTYEAIRLAQAGGLGDSAEQDVKNAPSVTLKEAMELASDRDAIAAQYTNNYREIFEISLIKLTESLNCGESVEWSTTLAYLYLLYEVPDSLISRKYGLERAQSVMNIAGKILHKIDANGGIRELEEDILLWDKELKKEATNPGTTADLTAATLLIHAFQRSFS